MSSGPMGLDAREYYWSFYDLEVAAGSVLIHTVTVNNAWLITRIRCFAGPVDPCQLIIVPPVGTPTGSHDIAPNGCLCLEPNGAYRGEVQVLGGGSRTIIEYWYQVNETGAGPTIVEIP